MPYTSEGIGYRQTDTSRAAADDMGNKAKAISARVLACLRAATGPLSADEIAERLRIDFMAVRPRLTELRERGLVEDSGARRPTRSGKRGIGWVICE